MSVALKFDRSSKPLKWLPAEVQPQRLTSTNDDNDDGKDNDDDDDEARSM